MSEWYYTSAGRQLGPVTSAQLKQAAQSGQLTPNDLVWKDGMPDWAPATKLKDLFDGAPASPAPAPTYDPASTPIANSEIYAPHAAPQPQQFTRQPGSSIGYFNPTSGLGARVANNLSGFPPPTGPQTDWPLNDIQLIQLAAAEKHRKAIRSFNSLCQFLVIICLLSMFVSLVTLGSAPPGLARTGPFMAGFGFALIFYLALAILYYLAGRAGLKCRLWGPVTVVILLSLGILSTFALMFFGVTAGPRRGPGPSAESVGLIVVFAIIAIFGAITLTVAVRGLLAIPRFLASPVWAQEALVAAKL